MTQPMLRESIWDVANLRWEHGPSPVQCVFRKGRGGWEPWVIVAESAVMNRAGKRGLGLYAARHFRRDEFVGRYEGRVIRAFVNREEALASPECMRLVRRGRDKLITRRVSNDSGVELVDGEDCPPPFLHRINDPRGSGLRSNIELTPGGWVKVIQREVLAFDLDAGLDANIRSELRFSYGDDYWSIMERLGNTAELPLEVDSG